MLLTVRDRIPVMKPVLIASPRWGPEKNNMFVDGGLRPFGKSPICRRNQYFLFKKKLFKWIIFCYLVVCIILCVEKAQELSFLTIAIPLCLCLIRKTIIVDRITDVNGAAADIQNSFGFLKLCFKKKFTYQTISIVMNTR